VSIHPLADIDPIAVAHGLAGTDGTILLHTQRDWYGTGASYLLFAPRWTIQSAGGRLVEDGPVPQLPRPAPTVGTRVEQLRSVLAEADHADLPLIAGYIGYDAGADRFGCRHPALPPFDVPDWRFAAYDAVLVFGDSQPPRLCVRDLSAIAGGAAEDRSRELLERVLSAAAQPLPRPGATGPTTMPERTWHRSAMERIRSHLRAGDSYQVNLTGFATAETDASPFIHFVNHGQENPVAFGAYLQVGNAAISSHSPERLLRVKDGIAETAPIKGTVAAAAGADRALRASSKDRAEHLMIVDLCRNDLGLRAESGAVRVADLMETIELRGIVHLISRIQARVRLGGRAGLLDSMFPGGSITGAPKRRSMEIISEVERSGRGPYTGSIGYVTPGGDMDFSIAIRTAVWQHHRVHFGCGGGIVMDSDPDAEYAEACLKAESFFRSFETRRTR
jgi:anthranilate/para-aminobenzoate synthase component I